jgi:hypothetical protein
MRSAFLIELLPPDEGSDEKASCDVTGGSHEGGGRFLS